MESRRPRVTFSETKDELQVYLDNCKRTDLRVVFDMGSKSTRLLIGPVIRKQDLRNWNPFEWFHIESKKFELLRSIHQGTGEISINDPALEKTIAYINEVKSRLSSIEGIEDDHFTLVGTEVFRLAKNRQAIIDRIRSRTGLTLTILKEESEAFLSLLALTHTYTCLYADPRTKVPPAVNFPKIDDDSIFLLFDQGGGSTEISYYSFGRKLFGKRSSLSEIGTNALRNRFFRMDSEGRLVLPSQHEATISSQVEVLEKYVTERIDSELAKHPEIVRIADSASTVYAFAMGSAIKVALEKVTKKRSGKYFNCSNITRDQILMVMFHSCNDLERSSEQVKKLYGKLTSTTGAISEKKKEQEEDELMLLYGLPVYLQLLERFKLDEIRYSYFNLKHGVFIARYFYNLKDINSYYLPVPSQQVLFDSRFDWGRYDSEEKERIKRELRQKQEEELRQKEEEEQRHREEESRKKEEELRQKEEDEKRRVEQEKNGSSKLEVYSDQNETMPAKKKVLILTAIKDEYNVVKNFFSDRTSVKHGSTGKHFYTGKLKGDDQNKLEFYFGWTDDGTANAVLFTAAALETTTPDLCVLVGTAGGIKDVNIGDVVVPPIVYGYEKGRDGSSFEISLDNFERPTKYVLRYAEGISEDESFVNSSLNRPSNESFGNDFKISISAIAAGEKVVRSNMSETCKFIKERFRDAVAVEMEGKGFLAACSAQSHKTPFFVVIKGISDLLDGKEEANKKGSKQLATENACKVAFEIIKRLN